MPRRHSPKKRHVCSDMRYQSQMVARFINKLMLSGKKSVASAVVYGAFDLLETQYSVNPLDCFNAGIENVRPLLELRGVRIGGANYQVPEPVQHERSYAKAMEWIVMATRKRSGRSAVINLAAELFDAMNKKGEAIKKRETTHSMAEANKAFAHYSPNRSKQKMRSNNNARNNSNF